MWKFNPPHFGGVWERLNWSTKRPLLLILGSRRLSFDIFFTINVETEAILNTRPLTNVAEQPDNKEPLTPNHFPIHHPFNNLSSGQFGDQHPASLRTWKNTQKLINHIWQCLVKKYLPTISDRQNGQTATIDRSKGTRLCDFWLIKDQTPRGNWPLGRVTATTPRRDGVTRFVKVKTAYYT